MMPLLTVPSWRRPDPVLRNRYFLAFDLVLVPVAALLAFVIRFEGFDWGTTGAQLAGWYVLLVLPLKILVFVRTGLYRRLWRYASVHEVASILQAAVWSSVLAFIVGALVIPGLRLAGGVRVPISVLFLDALLTTALVTLPRVALRLLAGRRRAERRESAVRVLVAGAGAAGAMIVKELHTNPQLDLIPVGFLDDNPAKLGNHLLGLPVLGPLGALGEIAANEQIDELIIAMPRAPGQVIRDLVAAAGAVRIRTRTVPGMFDIISGRVTVSTLRQVEIQDLLRREPVTTDLAPMQRLVAGRTVLVTGAGGSIGGELCRQLAELEPARIVLLGRGENSIFDALHELEARYPGVRFDPVIADIRDRPRLSRIFAAFEPVAILHAAAHKHVPLMECNIPEAISNNVFGTRNVVELAAEHDVERLVFISTDKAVRPASIMGATKRVAEQIVQQIAEEQRRNFVSVRFGNVLGSRSSVVPAVLRQIAAGGPVTVTHPAMRRYFMTIPESVQLVLQAATLGAGGEIFVLDMGEPLRIVDLVGDLIRLSGKELERDVEIRYTGIRPGEKLHEELFFSAQHAMPTAHPKVMQAKRADVSGELNPLVDELIAAASQGASDAVLRGMLQLLVADYQPSEPGVVPTVDVIS
ncbi:MAG: polysaccharide biosynthesis protein [Gemmatimonadales bacterium]